MSYPQQPPSEFPHNPQQPGPGGWPGPASSGYPAGQPGWPDQRGYPPGGPPPGYGAPPPGGPRGRPPKKSNTELIIGLAIGAVVLIALIVLAFESFSGGRGTPGDQEIPAVSRTAPAIPIPTTIHGTTHRSPTPPTSTGNPSRSPST